MSSGANFWGVAHGTAAEHGRLVSSETKPGDELRPATGSDSVRRDHGPDGRFQPNNTVAKSKRVRSGPRGSLAALEAKGEAAYQVANRWGRRYAAHRRGELASAHGGQISGAVAVIVEDSGDLRADAKYWRARGMAEGNAEFIKLSATLIAGARGCERDAWELAAREGAQPDRTPIDIGRALREAHK